MILVGSQDGIKYTVKHAITICSLSEGNKLHFREQSLTNGRVKATHIHIQWKRFSHNKHGYEITFTSMSLADQTYDIWKEPLQKENKAE